MNKTPAQDYWLLPTELENPLFSKEEISALNADNFAHDPNLFDVCKIPSEIESKYVESAIDSYSLSDLRNFYNIDGKHINNLFILEMQNQINKAPLLGTVFIQYALTIERCNLRSFPTNLIAMKEDLDEELDRFQETAVYPLEPVIILHTSYDRTWYFIQTYNYQGWLHHSSLIVVNHDVFKSCFSDEQFYYIIQDFVTLQITNNLNEILNIQMPMGSRIPKYLLENKINGISFHCTLDQKGISEQPSVFSRAAILRFAMQCLYDPYDWGGKLGYRDCSSFIVDVFRCFGITLPRNAYQQANYGHGVKCEWLKNSKDETLKLIKPGFLMFIPGHVMIYLGAFLKEHYVIHSVKEFYLSKNGTMEKSPVSGVQITPLSIYRKNWESYKSSIYTIMDLYINEWCWPIL
jgi:hypothetical protein